MANAYTTMLKMTDEQIIKHIDKSSGYVNPPQNYVSELWRRNQARETATMKRLTKVITWFTGIVLAATLLQLAIALCWIG